MPVRPGRRDRVEIPSTIERSERHARHIWKAARDWVAKGWKGPSDPHAAHGFREGANLPTAGGKVARTPAEARRKAKEARQEYAKAYRARKRRTTARAQPRARSRRAA